MPPPPHPPIWERLIWSKLWCISRVPFIEQIYWRSHVSSWHYLDRWCLTAAPADESSAEASNVQMARHEDMHVFIFFLYLLCRHKNETKTVWDGQMAQCHGTKSIILTASVSAKHSLSEICVWFNWGFSSFMNIFQICALRSRCWLLNSGILA